MNSPEQVILVDKNDQEIGVMEKLEAHQKGVLHRAFSVFLFNPKGEMLLQQRAGNKYHSPNLWSNTCCSHPRPNEITQNGANRRLLEELGIKSELKELFQTTYKIEFENGLIEHEYDHIFIGKFNGICNPNPHEVQAWKFMSFHSIEEELNQFPEKYSEWFKLIFPKVSLHQNKPTLWL